MTSERDIWLRRGEWLALATVAYNVAEGLISIGVGWADGSVAFTGFGVD